MEGRSDNGPVSYTHLDVYKRQNQRSQTNGTIELSQQTQFIQVKELTLIIN